MESLTGTILAVSVGMTGELVTGRRRIKSAFIKTPIVGRVWLRQLGLPGDEHVYEDHRGPDMALLAYPIEHYSYWRSLGLQLPEAAALGENLTVKGLVETQVNLGDVFEAGTAVVQVCQPRTPCAKVAARFGRKDMSVLVQDTGYTGYLLRVLTEGEVGANDDMVLVHRDTYHDVTVAEAGRVVNVDRNDHDGARRVLAVEALGTSVRRTLEARVGSGVELGLGTDRLFLPEAEQA